LTASLNSDPKFKKYAAQVDKCLQTFDNVHEWADFIAFLAKLLKVGYVLFTARAALIMIIDIPILHAIQGDPSQVGGSQTARSVS